VRPVAVYLDGVLVNTRDLWEEWLEEAAVRYRPLGILDPESLPVDRAAAAERLDAWADGGVGDWRALLTAFALEHAGALLRPDAEAVAVVAARSAHVGVFTDAPEELALVALAHVGLDPLAVAAGRNALERLLAELGPATAVVREREELDALDA
jgi:phosphoglycolate phosphatase-like HAD superfamily hydrolase